MAIIVLIQSKSATHRIRVTQQPFIVGRSSRCHLKIKDDFISGQHIAIRLEKNITVIKDLNSTNGTFLNGQKIDHTTLLIGEEVQIGGTTITLDVDSLNVFEKKNHLNTRTKTSVQFVSLPKEDTSIKKDITDSSFNSSQALMTKSKKQKLPPIPSVPASATSKQEASTSFKVIETPREDTEYSTDLSTNITTHQDYKHDDPLPPKKKYKKDKAVDFPTSSSEVNFDQETQGNTHMIQLKDIKRKRKKSKAINKKAKEAVPESIIARLISKIKELF